MPIRDFLTLLVNTPIRPINTPQWWEMVRYSMQEADRLGLQLGMHICDGFALAGGPWITPERIYAEGGMERHPSCRRQFAQRAPQAAQIIQRIL